MSIRHRIQGREMELHDLRKVVETLKVSRGEDKCSVLRCHLCSVILQFYHDVGMLRSH